MRHGEVLAVSAREEPVAGEGGRGEEVCALGAGVDAEGAGGFVCVRGGGLELGVFGAGPGVVARPEGEADEGGYVEVAVVGVELRFQGGDIGGGVA